MSFSPDKKTDIGASLYRVAEPQSGQFTIRQALEAGCSHQLLQKYLRSGKVTRLHRGIYRLVLFPSSDAEEFFTAWLWSDRSGVLSHATALQLHDLSDALPTAIDLTVPSQWRRRRVSPPAGTVLHYADLANEDRTWHGNLPITTIRRTLEDCVAVDLDPRLIQQATGQALRRGLVSSTELDGVIRALEPFGGPTP